jgi:hypothetical protein
MKHVITRDSGADVARVWLSYLYVYELMDEMALHEAVRRAGACVIDVAAVEQAFPKVQKLAPLAQSGQKDVLRGILDGELQAADAREEVRAASSFFVRTSNLDPNRTMMPAPAGGLAQADPHERQRFLMDALDRPIRVYGVVRNQGEPGGGPFWVSRPVGPAVSLGALSGRTTVGWRHRWRVPGGVVCRGRYRYRRRRRRLCW